MTWISRFRFALFRRCNPTQREEDSVCVNDEDGGRHLPDEHGHSGRRDLRPHHGCVRNPLSRERTLDTRSSRQILTPDLVRVRESLLLLPLARSRRLKPSLPLLSPSLRRAARAHGSRSPHRARRRRLAGRAQDQPGHLVRVRVKEEEEARRYYISFYHMPHLCADSTWTASNLMITHALARTPHTAAGMKKSVRTKAGASSFATVSARDAVKAGSVTREPQRRARGARVVSSRPSPGRVGRRALGRGRGGRRAPRSGREK